MVTMTRNPGSLWLPDYPDLVLQARYNAKQNGTSVVDIEPLFERSHERRAFNDPCVCADHAPDTVALVALVENFYVHYGDGTAQFMSCRIFGIAHGYRPHYAHTMLPGVDGWNLVVRPNTSPEPSHYEWTECDDYASAVALYRDYTGVDVADRRWSW